MSIIDKYLKLQKKFSKKYGEDNTIVLMQVGGFYEVYATENEGYDLHKLEDLLNTKVSRKNKKKGGPVDVKNPYMLGFPIHALNKFFRILINNYFTVVIIDQVTPAPNPKREITGIYSPGTVVQNIDTPDSNNMISIYIEEEKQFRGKKYFMCVGLSVIDLSTGHSVIHEVISPIDDKNYALDEVVRFINTYQPKEILLNTVNIKSIKSNELISYLEMGDKFYRHNMDRPKDIHKITYQNKFLEKAFPNRGMLSPIEYLNMEKNIYSRMSFIILLQYAYDHKESIINNLKSPEYYKGQRHLHLGNNAIYQLNVLTPTDSGYLFNRDCKFKSLYDVINKTSTCMGKRYLKDCLLNPIINADELNKRYDLIEKMMINYYYLEAEDILKNIMDIERRHRLIALGSLHPFEFSNLHLSYNYVMKLVKWIENNENFKHLIDKKRMKKFRKFINDYQNIFDLEEIAKYELNDISNSFFIKGFHKDIDDLQRKIDGYKSLITDLARTLNKYFRTYNKKKKDYMDDSDDEDEKEYVEVKYSEKDKSYLKITKPRFKFLESKLENVEYIELDSGVKVKVNETVIDTKGKEKIQSTWKVKIQGSYVKIFINEINDATEELYEDIGEMRKIAKEVYTDLLFQFHKKYCSEFAYMENLVSFIDFIKTGAKIAIKYNYCKPSITPKDKSFLDIKNLRHPIIERIINTEYVPHDIKLGSDDGLDGMLLFGLNSVGKSSLQKAIGLSVILAQMGFYVPAESFNYSPYFSLFTRISGSDNLFKGLSSFTLEITELRAILKRSGKNTLVIADEVCNGTENKSGKVIVLTMLEMLSKSGTSFITATHLHEIVDTERLKKLENVKCFHLHVEVDEQNDKLIYDRKLREGNGRSEYGLDVAKHIINDQNFMSLANEIKKELENSGNLVSDKTSKYNSNVYITECTVCQNRDNLEVHHIKYQKDTDKNGFILEKQHVHKNHKSNLVVLCEKCHDDIHSGKIVIRGYQETSNGVQLDIEKNPISSKKTNKKYDKNTIDLVRDLNKKKRMTQRRAKEILWDKHKIKMSVSTIGKIWNYKYVL